MNRHLSLALFIIVTVVLSACQDKQQAYIPQSFDDLKGHTICIMEGSVQQDYVMAHFKDADVKYIYFPSSTDCMLALNNGKADMFFGADIYTYNEAFHRQNLKICHLVPECGGYIGLGVKKDNTALASDMNAFMDSLKQCGALKKIVNRWFNPENTDFHNCVKIAPTSGKPSQGSRILKVGIGGAKPPVEALIDNKWTGCEIELLQMYTKSRGMEMAIDTYDFDNLIPAVQSGKADIVAASLCINAERKKKITFITPYTTLSSAFIIPNPDKQSLSTWQQLKQSAYYSLVAENRWKLLVDGLWITIIIAFFSLLLGSILGGGVCWLRMNSRKTLMNIGRLYVSLMRNIPMLVFLMLMFYVILADTGLPTIIVAIIAFGMNSAAYICEIYRTGIQSIDRGQREAGLALGFSPLQTFLYIIAPQAIHNALPVFKNETVTLLKGTSIVGYISIIDLTKASDLIRSASFEAFFPLIVITVAYFILAWLFTTIIDVLVKRI